MNKQELNGWRVNSVEQRDTMFNVRVPPTGISLKAQILLLHPKIENYTRDECVLALKACSFLVYRRSGITTMTMIKNRPRLKQVSQ